MKTENKEDFCTIYLVRHGKTEWNKKKITQGQSESPISSIGIKQAKKTAKKLEQIKFNAIYSSDLSMAYNTAEIIKLNRKIPILKSQLLRGRLYGIFEGKHVDLYKDTLKEKFKERESLPEAKYSSFKLEASIETDKEVTDRIVKKLKKISKTHLNENILVVTHGGCIKNLLIETGYIERKLFTEGSFKHGGYMIILLDGKNFKIKEMDGMKK